MDECAVDSIEQGYKRLCGKQKRAVEVNGVKLAATYQPVWNGHTHEFTKYMEELEDMLMSNNLQFWGHFN